MNLIYLYYKVPGCFFSLIILFGNASICQDRVTLIDKDVNPGEIINEKLLEKEKTRGSDYLFNDWQLGDIYLNTGNSIKGYFLNYDLSKNYLEIKLKEEVKIASSEKFDSFFIFFHKNALHYEKKFINSRFFNFGNINPINGFLEVLDSGSIMFLKYYELKVKESNYVPTVDMGRNYDQKVKDLKYFIAKDKELHKLPSNKKSFAKFFGDKDGQILSFIKDNKLSLKEEKDVITVLNHFNN